MKSHWKVETNKKSIIFHVNFVIRNSCRPIFLLLRSVGSLIRIPYPDPLYTDPHHKVGGSLTVIVFILVLKYACCYSC